MNSSHIDALFKEQQISVITFSTSDATFAIPLEQILYIEKDVKRNVQIDELKEFNHEIITYQNDTVQLHDFNSLVGSSNHQQNMQELVSKLDEMEQLHKDWLDSLEESITHNTPFTAEISSNKCAFCRWYNQFETDNEELKEVFERLDEPHKKLHSLASELLRMHNGDRDQALSILEKERHATLANLIHLLHLAKERALNSVRPIIVFVENNEKKVTALRLDNINDIVVYNRNSFSQDDSTEGLLKKKSKEFAIEGFLRNGDDAPAMLINCKPIQHDAEVA